MVLFPSRIIVLAKFYAACQLSQPSAFIRAWDRHQIAMAFTTQWLHYIRYQYTCCKLNTQVCNNRKRYNRYTYATHSSGANYLARQLVSCGRYGYVSSLGLQRSYNKKKIRFVYNCCYLRYQKYRQRTSCYSGHTSWTFNKNQKSFYLSRQTVRCKPRYFLSEFRLKNKYSSWSSNGHFRYYYRCCRIKS